MKNLILDLDHTISITENGDYQNSKNVQAIIDKIHYYKKAGFKIVIYSSRNMRTYENNIGKINKHTLPTIVKWLDLNNVPYDELYVGKPWCGFDGFYVDDKSIRPSEFANLSYEEIKNLLQEEKDKIEKL
jgi:capsule biosynthesis phosphatase